jgi:hypothetical protein
MKQCPQCSFENIRNRFYCEQCGTILPSSTSQQVKTPPSRSQEYASSSPSQRTLPSSSPILPPPLISHEEPIAPAPYRTQELLYTTARAVLYLLGTIIAAFGLYTFLAVFTRSAIIGFISFFPGSIILLTLAFILHRVPALHWWQRLLIILATTGGALVLLLFGAIIVGMQPTESMDKVANIVYGSIILLYGVVIAVVALW